jgi:DNA polymerase elongation subunit (family B)
MDPSLKKSIEEEGEDDDKFAGAYVKDPVPGLYGWNIDLDEQSLYPLTILQLNASPETFIFKIVTDDPFDMSWTLKQMKDKDGEKEVQVMKRNWTVTTIKLKNLIKFIEDNECTVAPNGTVYSTDQVGMICEVVEQWFMKRNDYKNEMKKYGKMGDKVKYDFYNTFQGIYKILLNSIYGVLGLKSFRYSDGRDIMAESVTISGRFIITQTADYINEKINKELGD